MRACSGGSRTTSYSDIQVKLNESTSAHDRLDRIARSAVGSPVEIHHCFTNSVIKEVVGIFGTRILQLFLQCHRARTVRLAQ